MVSVFSPTVDLISDIARDPDILSQLRQTFTLSYKTWKNVRDLIEELPAFELAAALTPFFVELGPFAPVVAAAISYGSREFLLSIMDKIPHGKPITRAEQYSALRVLGKMFGHETQMDNIQALNNKRPAEDLDIINDFIQKIPFKPVVSSDFRERPIQRPIVKAEIYPKKMEYFLHPRVPKDLGNGGPNATYAGIGF